MTGQCVHCKAKLAFHNSTTSMFQHLSRKHPGASGTSCNFLSIYFYLFFYPFKLLVTFILIEQYAACFISSLNSTNHFCFHCLTLEYSASMLNGVECSKVYCNRYVHVIDCFVQLVLLSCILITRTSKKRKKGLTDYSTNRSITVAD